MGMAECRAPMLMRWDHQQMRSTVVLVTKPTAWEKKTPHVMEDHPGLPSTTEWTSRLEKASFVVNRIMQSPLILVEECNCLVRIIPWAVRGTKAQHQGKSRHCAWLLGKTRLWAGGKSLICRSTHGNVNLRFGHQRPSRFRWQGSSQY